MWPRDRICWASEVRVFQRFLDRLFEELFRGDVVLFPQAEAHLKVSQAGFGLLGHHPIQVVDDDVALIATHKPRISSRSHV